MNTRQRPTIHYTELAPAEPGSVLAAEWETYRREVGRLLAEGHEGKWVLIKGDEVIGLFDSQQQALAAGSERFLLQPKLVHHVLSREPVLRYFPRYNWKYDPPHAIHYTKLAPAAPRSVLAVEWETYRREVGRLIAEGHEGKWVLIKGEEIIGVFDSQEQAHDIGSARFLLQPKFIHRVLSHEPVLVISPRYI
jgi:hypothetical protein